LLKSYAGARYNGLLVDAGLEKDQGKEEDSARPGELCPELGADDLS